MIFKTALISLLLCVITLLWVIIMALSELVNVGDDILWATLTSQTRECLQKPLRSSSQTTESQKGKTTFTTPMPPE